MSQTRATHKTSGLSISIINRMLASPRLPPRVRLIIFEYIEEKRAGMYGTLSSSYAVYRSLEARI